MITLPNHKATLYLTHNEHLSDYKTVKDYIEDKHPAYDKNDFISEEDMQKCVDTNECWQLHWYPNTPIGSYCVNGSDLKLVIDYAMEIDAELKKASEK